MAMSKKTAAKQSISNAAGNAALPTVHDAPFEKALHDLWTAIAVSPIDFIDKVTGKAFTRARFQSIKAGRTVKDIEKFTKHVRKLTKSLAAFVESGGSLETIRDDVRRLGQPAARKAAKGSPAKSARSMGRKTARTGASTASKGATKVGRKAANTARAKPPVKAATKAPGAARRVPAGKTGRKVPAKSVATKARTR